MEKKKKSIIEELKSDSVSFKKWYKYVSLYNIIITKLTINECISFIKSLINSNVTLNNNEEERIYKIVIKKLQRDLDMICGLREVIGSNKVDKKTKI